MSSDEEFFAYDTDSGNESPAPDDDDPEKEDYDIDMGLGEEAGGGPAGPSGARQQDEEYAFEVLSTEKIVQNMVDIIKEVNSVMEIPATTVRILLNHFKWDKEKLLDKFYAGENRDSLFAEAKVVSPYKALDSSPSGSGSSSTSASTKGAAAAAAPAPMECEICCMKAMKSMMTGLECGHQYCTTCWTEYLVTKIMHEGASQSIECPGCEILVDDQTVMRLVKDPKVKLKYQHLITNSFVECNRLMRWCSAPDCNHAIKVQHVEAKAVKCNCDRVFCFACSQDWHDPVRCHLIRKWIKKCDDDSETSNWISANTKECPACRATIEKDGGCNHMICKNTACKADFCWVCLGPWEPHGSSWYNCNRFDEDEAKNNRSHQETSRLALTRYLFYCNRYMNHLQSLKFENKLYSMVKDQMEEMQQHNMSWIEVQFLKKAVDILCECRRTLMYTYVFAYYLVKNNQSELFEDNQRDLEQATEKLSEYLERDITGENVVDIKQKVQDMYRYCDHRRNTLLRHVHEGYEKDWWVYTEPDLH